MGWKKFGRISFACFLVGMGIFIVGESSGKWLNVTIGLICLALGIGIIYNE